MDIHKNPNLLFWALLVTILFLGGCATTPVPPQKNIVHVQGVTKILLVQPFVESIDSTSNNKIELNNSIGDKVTSSITSEVHSAFSIKQIDASRIEDLTAHDNQSLEKLEDLYLSIKLHPSSISDNHKASLNRLASSKSASHILLFRCRLYVGPDGFWNPMSGAIASNCSRVVLEGLLYHINEKKIDWSHATQVRTSVKADDTCVPKMTTELLSTLEIK